METTMTTNGISTTTTDGQEQYELVKSKRVRTGKPNNYYIYDYRHTDGTLFTTAAKTLEECRRRRDQWLLGKVV